MGICTIQSEDNYNYKDKEISGFEKKLYENITVINV